jgi:PD-(D/E)XK endonuclease
MTTERTWTDDSLRTAVAAATSWRGVMRELGLNPSNGGVTRTIRGHAARLGLDYSHFRANRSWSDAALRQAITESRTWAEALTTLGLSGSAGGERTLIRGHAVRLGLDISHLGQPAPPGPAASQLEPHLTNLRFAAESLAAAWFALRSCGVAFPVVPSPYDLLISASEGIQRVQVKTTTRNTKDGWEVQVARRPYSVGNNALTVPYNPEDVDLFFIVDGDLTMYVIPMIAIAGRMRILLRTYKKYIVGNAAGLWAAASRVA